MHEAIVAESGDSTVMRILVADIEGGDGDYGYSAGNNRQ